MGIKVLYLSINRQFGMEDAFRNVGCEVLPYDYHTDFQQTRNLGLLNQKLINYTNEFKPDLIHCQLHFNSYFSADTWAKCRQIVPNVIITQWNGDTRLFADAGLIRTSHSCDYSFLCGTGQIEMHKAAGGKNIKYWQVAMDPKFNYPKNQTEFKYDISFLASIHPPQLFPENPIRITIAQ